MHLSRDVVSTSWTLIAYANRESIKELTFMYLKLKKVMFECLTLLKRNFDFLNLRMERLSMSLPNPKNFCATKKSSISKQN